MLLKSIFSLPIAQSLRSILRTMSANCEEKVLLEMVRSIVPPLTSHLHKGQCGRIGIVGGCRQYTGAPYFAAISALKVGADLSYVFCTQDAAPVIKSYSPELIVFPVLDNNSAITEVSEVLPKLHCLVVGPGLGRDELLLHNVKGIIEKARSLQLPLVIDADAVYLLSMEPKIITGYEKAVLTPNSYEFGRLYSSVTLKKTCNQLSEVQELSRTLGNVTIVKKGEEDVIANASHTLICTVEGSQRRCGGQGDLLAGSLGTFSHWAHSAADQLKSSGELPKYGPTMCAAYAACLLTRLCAKTAFVTKRRSTMTTDLIANIGDVFNAHFEQ